MWVDSWGLLRVDSSSIGRFFCWVLSFFSFLGLVLGRGPLWVSKSRDGVGSLCFFSPGGLASSS